MESDGTDTKEAFSDDTCIESAFGREMPLIAFGPRLDRIWHMVAKQSLPGILPEITRCFIGGSDSISSSEGIKG